MVPSPSSSGHPEFYHGGGYTKRNDEDYIEMDVGGQVIPSGSTNLQFPPVPAKLSILPSELCSWLRHLTPVGMGP